MLVAFSLRNSNFLAELSRLASLDHKLHNQILVHLASVSGTDFNAFATSHRLSIHGAHFSEPVLFADFFIPQLPVQIYSFLEQKNDLPTGLVIPFAFWQPKV